MSNAILVTREYERIHLIERVKADLERKAIRFSTYVIEQVLEAYDKRRSA